MLPIENVVGVEKWEEKISHWSYYAEATPIDMLVHCLLVF